MVRWSAAPAGGVEGRRVKKKGNMCSSTLEKQLGKSSRYKKCFFPLTSRC